MHQGDSYSQGASAMAATSDDRSARSQATSTTDRVVEVPLYREELRVGKREVPRGGVVIRKVVESERQSLPVELQREEVVIERITADQAQQRLSQGSAGEAFNSKEMVIELTREVPTVEKRTEVTEVVRARKTTDTRQETVSDTVRREQIHIDRQNLQANADTRSSSAQGASALAESGANQQNAPQRATQASANEGELYLHQERLEVAKRRIPAGRVVLRKSVETERVSQPIQLRREDVQVDRERVTGRQGAAENAFANREIFIPLMEEVPTVQKEVQLSEIVRARTNVETERETVGGEVRRERAEVARDQSARGDAATRQSNSQGAPAGASISGGASVADASIGAEANASATRGASANAATSAGDSSVSAGASARGRSEGGSLNSSGAADSTEENHGAEDLTGRGPENQPEGSK